MQPIRNYNKQSRLFSLSDYQIQQRWKVKKQYCHQININSTNAKKLRQQQFYILRRSLSINFEVENQDQLKHISQFFPYMRHYRLKIKFLHPMNGIYFLKFLFHEIKKLSKDIRSLSIERQNYYTFKDKYLKRIAKHISTKRRIESINLRIPVKFKSHKIYTPEIQHIKHICKQFKKFLHQLQYLNIMNHFLDSQHQSLHFKYGQELASISSLKSISISKFNTYNKSYFQNFKKLLQGLGSATQRMKISFPFDFKVRLPRTNLENLHFISNVKTAAKDVNFNISHSFNQQPYLFDLLKLLSTKDNLSIRFEGVPFNSIKSKDTIKNFVAELKLALKPLQAEGVNKFSFKLFKKFQDALIDPIEILDDICQIPSKQRDIYINRYSSSIEDANPVYWKVLDSKMSSEMKVQIHTHQMNINNMDQVLKVNQNLLHLSIKYTFRDKYLTFINVRQFLKKIMYFFPNLQRFQCLVGEYCKKIQIFDFSADWEFFKGLQYLDLHLGPNFMIDFKRFRKFLFKIKETWKCREFQFQFIEHKPNSNLKEQIPYFADLVLDSTKNIIKSKNFYDYFGSW